MAMTDPSNPPSVVRHELARRLDVTLRRAEATARELEALCAEARAHGVFGVCVNSSRVVQAAHWLEDSEVKLICAVGFPSGAAEADVKRYETEVAIDGGAQLIEVSASLGRLKDGDDAAVLRELRDVIEAADERPVSLRFDPELLRAEECERLARLALEAGAGGLTLAGEAGTAAAVHAVKLVRATAGEGVAIKLDAESVDLVAATALLQAGATRLGLANWAELIGAATV